MLSRHVSGSELGNDPPDAPRATRREAEDGASSVPPAIEILVLCTGNAARSVMAGYMLTRLAEGAGVPLRVTTAGTHALEGQPMGWRTRAALAAVEALGEVPVSRHRSRQLLAGDLDRAALVVAMESDHVRFVRRRQPEAADRTATIRWLCRELPAGPQPLAERVAGLLLAAAPLDEAEDVADPAGRDDDAYVACAFELWALCQELVERL